MAMSEPGAGTDVLGMRTAAVDAGDHYVLDGSKMWITNGCVDSETLGDGALVYARTGPGKADVSLFHVGPENPGFSLGQRITGKLGMRASPTAELVFEGCVVPKEDLVSEWNGAALCMMRNLELERVILAAMAVGIAKRCVDRMGKYAAERAAFGRPIAEFGQMQRHVAESYAKLMAARAYLYATAGNLDLRTAGNRLDTDGVKLFATTRVASFEMMNTTSRLVGDDRRQGRRRRRDPGPRRLRLRRGVPGRAALARREAPRDRRRHAREPPQEHDPRPRRGPARGRLA